MSPIKTVFNEDGDVYATKKAFFAYLGDLASLGQLFYDIKELWVDGGVPVTEILLKEEDLVYVSVLKAALPYTDRDGNELMIDKNAVSEFVTFFAKSIDTVTEFSISVFGLGVLRCSYSEDSISKGISVRFLSYMPPLLDNYGYPKVYSDYIKALVQPVRIVNPVTKEEPDAKNLKGGGIIFHVGATGSGKSTGIAAELGYLANIVSGVFLGLERPIEYRYMLTKARVRQYELGRNIGNEEAQIFEFVLRNNPSLIMYGECRTKEEIRMVMNLASRGHLVITTFHAANVIEAYNTLNQVLGDDRFLLGQSLKAIVAHAMLLSGGKLVPLHEYLILDDVAKKQMADGKSDYVRDIMYKEKNTTSRNQSFSDRLKELVAEGKITNAEAKMFSDNNAAVVQ